MSNPPADQPLVSIVIPVFNEEGNLRPLWERIQQAVACLPVSCEIIFVDDGSRDGSFAVLADIQRSCPQVRVIRFRKNFGQHPALIAGVDHARGKWVLMLDADLQNDPADLKAIYDKLQEGYEVVSGVRTRRQDPLLRRKLPSRIVNHFVATRTGFVQTDLGCALRGFTIEAARDVALYTDVGGFITATIGALAFRYAEVPVRHAERMVGESRYGILVQLDQFMGIFTGYARRPFQVVELIGGGVVLAGLGMLGVVLVLQLQPVFLQALLAILLAAVGLVLGTLGIVGEYAVRISRTTRRWPRYLIAEIRESGSKSDTPSREP